jgi:Rad3-related DNA helicase
MIRQARNAVEKLFQAFGRLVEEYMQQGTNGNGRDKGRGDAGSRGHGGRSNERTDQPLRLTTQLRSIPAWADVERVWQQTTQRIQAVIDLTHEAEKLLLTSQRNNRRSSGGGDENAVASELAVAAYHLTEQKKRITQALSLAESDSVYWLRVPSTPFFPGQRATDTSTAQSVEAIPVLYAQLVQTSALVKRLLLKEDTSTIFAGTALSVDNSFAYYRNRFGLDADVCPALSVVTEHHEQTLLCIPSDVPEPNMPQYQRHLDDALVRLATTLDGQLVALFTSHAALRSSYATIKPILEARGILVLGQGIDGSPRQLWQIVQEQERIVVLSIMNSWEAMDEASYAPTCVVITRLPMPVLNDPPIAARAEQYSDQLHHLTVPVAALRIRRALNRLLWNGNKRNAVVLFDRRVISKEYGSIVLNTLPRSSQRKVALSHMPETILDWLTAIGAWE